MIVIPVGEMALGSPRSGIVFPPAHIILVALILNLFSVSVMVTVPGPGSHARGEPSGADSLVIKLSNT